MHKGNLRARPLTGNEGMGFVLLKFEYNNNMTCIMRCIQTLGTCLTSVKHDTYDWLYRSLFFRRFAMKLMALLYVDLIVRQMILSAMCISVTRARVRLALRSGSTVASDVQRTRGYC